MSAPYDESPIAYDVLHAARRKDYGREAAEVADRIRRHRPDALTLLDVGCGTGRHLAAFAELGFAVEGLDASPAMLAVARQRVRGVPLHEGDMRTFHLDRRFDAVVCLFGSIGYMTDVAALDTAVATMAGHVADGGVLAVEPWLTPERWHDGQVFAEGARDGDLAVARVSRSWREGDNSLIEMHYALARPDRTWSFTEVHRMGLFTTEQQAEVFGAAGLSVEHEDDGVIERGLFVLTKRITPI